MIIVSGEISLDAGKAAQVMDAAKAMMAETRKEDGCISYNYGVSVVDPATLVILERWRDQAAVDFHFATPHMATFLAALGELSIADFSVNRYNAEDLGPLS